jgi:hypothetical protein
VVGERGVGEMIFDTMLIELVKSTVPLSQLVA